MHCSQFCKRPLCWFSGLATILLNAPLASQTIFFWSLHTAIEMVHAVCVEGWLNSFLSWKCRVFLNVGQFDTWFTRFYLLRYAVWIISSFSIKLNQSHSYVIVYSIPWIINILYNGSISDIEAAWCLFRWMNKRNIIAEEISYKLSI
jgi:hypothetical protein